MYNTRSLLCISESPDGIRFLVGNNRATVLTIGN